MIKILFIYLSWYFCFMLSEEIYVICNTMGHKENIVCFFFFSSPLPSFGHFCYLCWKSTDDLHTLHALAGRYSHWTHLRNMAQKVKCDKIKVGKKHQIHGSGEIILSTCSPVFSTLHCTLHAVCVASLLLGEKKSCCKGKCFLVPFSVAHYSGGWSKSSKVIHKHGEKERGIFAEWFGCLDKTKTPWHTV